jgi:hypothetical protein
VWRVAEGLKLTLGLRADIPIIPDDPLRNPDTEDAFGLATDRAPGSHVLWSPRLSFSYDAFGDRTTRVRGGAGVFSGVPPFVWIADAFANTGAGLARVEAANLPAGFFVPSADPADQPRPPQDGLTPLSATSVNLIDEDIRFPQVLRLNLAVDQALPLGVVGTVEGLYTRGLHDVLFENLNLAEQGRAFDGRPLYARLDERFTDAILLENADGEASRARSLTLGLEREQPEGLRARLFYTYTRAQNQNNLTARRATANWQFNESRDPNDPRLGTADFEVRHRVLADVGFTTPRYFQDRLATTVSVVYQGQSGSPTSWVYAGDANGDGQASNDLVYVPQDEDDVVLTTDNWAALDAFIESRPGLRAFRGQVVPRNSARGPWQNRLDLSVQQRLFTVGAQHVELTATVFNVLNLLDPDWGAIREARFNNVTLLGFDGYVQPGDVGSSPTITEDDLGKPKVRFSPEDEYEDYFTVQNVASRWRMQLGLRYTF